MDNLIGKRLDCRYSIESLVGSEMCIRDSNITVLLMGVEATEVNNG